jgi:hypothetical protein
MTVTATLRVLVRNPYRLVSQWNWKAAILSGVIRGGIFFIAGLSFGIGAATRALLVDLAFRVPLSGLYGTLTQVFTGTEPAWAASAIVMVLLPVVSHAVEFVAHTMSGTLAVHAGVAASVAFTALSSVFSLFAMRRGLLLVGHGNAQSFLEDVVQLPMAGLAFLRETSFGTWRLVRRCVGC